MIKASSFIFVLWVAAGGCFRDMLHRHAPVDAGVVGEELLRKRANCQFMREIFDRVMLLYGAQFKREKDEREAGAFGRFLHKVFSGCSTRAAECRERELAETIKHLLNEKWDYERQNNGDSLGTVFGSSMFHRGRQCMHVSQLWIIVSFVLSQDLYHDDHKFLTNLLFALYDSSEVLYQEFMNKEKITLSQISLIDKENLFRDFVMFALATLIPDAEELLFAVYESKIADKPTLIEEFAQLNLYVLADKRAFAAAVAKEAQEHYWTKLLGDVAEASSYLGLYILNVATTKLAAKVPVVGPVVNQTTLQPLNRFLLKLTTDHFDGLKPKEIEEYQLNLDQAIKGKTRDLVHEESDLYSFVKANLKCRQCQASFFDLLDSSYSRQQEKHLI